MINSTLMRWEGGEGTQLSEFSSPPPFHSAVTPRIILHQWLQDTSAGIKHQEYRSFAESKKKTSGAEFFDRRRVIFKKRCKPC